MCAIAQILFLVTCQVWVAFMPVLLQNCNILFTSDLTLTIETVMTATEGVEMPESGACLHMPHEVYKEIIQRNGKGRKGREAVFAELLSHHPYPRWELVVNLLHYLEYQGKARPKLAQEVKEKYLTSK